MIRTNSVTLSVTPGLAYRQKLASGGSSIVILRADTTQPGIASISKTTGDPILSSNTSPDLYPVEAFSEAMELTAGMPYKKQGKPKLVAQDLEAAAAPAAEPELDMAEPAEVEVIVDTNEYRALVAAFTNKKGKLSYDLINKELIQLAHRSDVVSEMIEAGEPEDAIRLYVVGTKFRNVTGNKDLSDEQVLKMAELLDEVSPKGVFKDLNADIRARLGKSKRT